jgi:hypothetical protein
VLERMNGNPLDELMPALAEVKASGQCNMLDVSFELDKVSKRLGWLIKLVGIAAPDGQTPLDLRMTFWGQKEQSRSCLKRMQRWNPEKVILAHGRWYENNGAAELRRAFRWLE